MKCLLVALVCLFCVGGCVTSAQQIRLNELVAEKEAQLVALAEKLADAYEVGRTQTEDVKAKVDAGTLTASEGKEYLDFLSAELTMAANGVHEQIASTKAAFGDAQQDILDSGKSRVEYWGGIILAMIVNALGLNAWRNRKHPLSTSIG